MESNIEQQQVKSKERVKDFGEVFTNPREVKAMLDLVKEESYRVDSRFLEPACGNGNFLVEILDRKLKTVSEVATNKPEWINLALVGVGAIYGIDIQKDNVEESIERLLTIVDNKCDQLYESLSENEKNAFEFVMKENIIHGNGLTGILCKANGDESKRELMFSEWGFDNLLETGEVIRKDFSMNEMIAHNKKAEAAEKISSQAGSLFAMAPQEVVVEELKPVSVKIYDNFYKEET